MHLQYVHRDKIAMDGQVCPFERPIADTVEVDLRLGDYHGGL